MKSIIILTLFFFSISFAQSISFSERNATVWAREQNINGKLNSYEPNIILYINGSSINSPVNSVDSSFSIPIVLNEGLTNIVAAADTLKSDTLKLTLGYNIRPDVYAYALVDGKDITLKGSIIENPDSSVLTFLWQQDSQNPSVVSIINSSDTSANFSIPQSAPYGEYYFDLYTYSSNGDTVTSRTFITVYPDTIKAFDIKKDHASWIDKAVIYEITPYIFVYGHSTWDQIAKKIPDLVQLGVNTIWLQPVYSTHGGGQGYDVTNYFSVRSDIGSEEQLGELIQKAKSYGLRVLFDIPINHSSIYHSYARNSSTYGEDSHYYDFYQRDGQNLDVPYAEDYHQYGGFINYFWNDLPNLNYNNPEVRKWMAEACEYWIKKYDIDGYRFDAIWGVNARDSNFTQQLRFSLKKLKPEILMLAEDKASHTMVFNNRFDAAFDWTTEESWVSHWSWQTDYNPNGDPTIFNNSNQNIRSNLLRNALTNNGNGYASNAKILRFMENNDTQRFISFHSLAQTKMIAAFMFALNGIPLIYNGQEIGNHDYPYSAEYIFYPGYPINHDDPNHLFPYYQRLINLRGSFPALYSNKYREISVTPNDYVFAFRRWQQDQNIFCLLNMGNTSTNASLSIPVNNMNLDSAKTYFLTDMINGEVFSGSPKDFSSINIQVTPYTTRLFLFADTAMVVTGIAQNNEKQLPVEYSLSQNYPNPFNPSTVINYSIPKDGETSLKVYDILGREISTLVSGFKTKGKYKTVFNGENLSSGVYIYRLEYQGNFLTHKMLLVK
jgi:glycosidase